MRSIINLLKTRTQPHTQPTHHPTPYIWQERDYEMRVANYKQVYEELDTGAHPAEARYACINMIYIIYNIYI